jgi:WD40 repeat protein
MTPAILSPRRLISLSIALLCLGAATAEKKPRRDLHGEALPEGAVARLGSFRLRHTADVTFVAALPDGKKALTVSADHIVRLWELSTGKLLRQFSLKQRQPPIIASFSADCTRLVTAAREGKELQLREVDSGRVLLKITPAPATAFISASLSPDGSLIAAGDKDKVCHLYDAKNGKELRTFGKASREGSNPESDYEVRFSPDSKRLLTSYLERSKSSTRSLKSLWDVSRGSTLFKLSVGENPAATLGPATFSPDGKRLALTDPWGKVLLIDAITGKLVKSIESEMGPLDGLCFTVDGTGLIGRSSGGRSIRIWDFAAGKEVGTIGGTPRAASQFDLLENRQTGDCKLAALPDGKTLLNVGGNLIRVIDLKSGSDSSSAAGHGSPIQAMRYSEGGKTIMTYGGEGTIFLWDAATGKQLKDYRLSPAVGAYTLSQDGKLVDTDRPNDGQEIVELGSSKVLHRMPYGEGFDRQNATRSPDGNTLAMRSSASPKVRLRNLKSGKYYASITQGDGSVYNPEGIDFGGGAIGVGGIGALGDAARFSSLPPPTFSPDSRSIAVPLHFQRAGLSIYEVASGGPIRQFPVPRKQQVRHASFTADGRMLCAVLYDSSVVVYEVSSGQQRFQFVPEGNDKKQLRQIIKDASLSSTFPVVFSPDGQRLYVAAPDNHVVVYNLLAGKLFARLPGHPAGMTAFAVAPDETTLATGGKDGTGLVWALPKPSRGQRRELKPAELESAWGALAAPDAGAAFKALLRLARSPTSTVPFLSRQIKATSPVDVARIQKLVAALDDHQFAARQEAEKELEILGPLAVPTLQNALDKTPSLEVRRRIELLLPRAKRRLPSAPELQTLRAVEALEYIATPEARTLLKTLASGAADARQTTEAKAALARLGK